MTKWEYRIKKFPMPSDWEIGETKWAELQTDHFYMMTELGNEGWEYMMNIGSLFYFKRPIQDFNYKKYTYESTQDGYVIFGPDGRKIPGWDLEKLLNKEY